MDKAERETHDFMNVESFAQLPFIRPAPPKDKGIRLFGIEFGGGGASIDESESAVTNPSDDHKDGGAADAGESGRKFECHYCCRNFPTSQALGGHQNAHKRERQHAKRAHLHSAALHGGAGGLLSDAHVYGLVNYRLGSAAPAAYSHLPWGGGAPAYSATASQRLYGGHGGSYSSHPPISGSPLAFWRIPSVQGSTPCNLNRSVHRPLTLLANDDLKPPPAMGGASAPNRYAYEAKSSVQDPVSLDLHL